MDDIQTISIGHNNPPEATPFELSKEEIDGLMMEAKNWLDGDPVESQQQADAIGKLINDLRSASKTADARRAAEKKPFDDAAKAVQAKYKPLLDQADLAMRTSKKALAPFLAKIEEAKRAEAEKARKEAEEKARIAREAMEAARKSETDLSAKADAKWLASQAKMAEKDAKRASRETAGARGGGRAITLREIHTAHVDDIKAFAAYVWNTHRTDLDQWFVDYASKLVQSGARNIPGVSITTEKVAQ